MSPAGLELVEVGTDPDRLACYGALMLETQPEHARSVAQMLAMLELDPTQLRVLALLDGAPVGVASVGRIWVLPPDNPAAWCELGVAAAWRRRGIGTALLAWAGASAPAIGRSLLQVPCSGARQDGIDFLLQRGFTEYDRMKSVELPLAGVVAPPVELPAGVRLTSLAEAPELRQSAYALATAVFADLPDPEPVSAGTYDEWIVRDVETPDGPLDGYLLAVAGDQVVGYCRLMLVEGGSVVSHSMTGTHRDWRGRGVAQALKHAAIAWALAAGAERMTAENAEGNAPMRVINAKLGYRPAPDFIELRGPAGP